MVFFNGTSNNPEILDELLKLIRKYAKNASFFIQLSSYEGMAMSVSESMQLGLIPIVTNVGQIKIYCKNLFNSLTYHDNEKEVINKEKALEIFSNMGETFKKEIINDLDESQEISLYKQGDWFDLWRGPHLPNSTFIKSFKLLSVAGRMGHRRHVKVDDMAMTAGCTSSLCKVLILFLF